ncbi:universal stress protein [Flammeovirga kamogawensis]|uniref:Universal stress protein n=1 Tax=Flammeovirga kamogawensis TaxID=373891 RepID=A0ABX8GW62_9BACT|nr:universal stress protein [Flammeovirga kamogawensis]MBB6459751.1 nucleotide-binding universal stress UspA family protein [Flammeovirga kamogawensis]QWG07190.1 universal stress protein [Flammeovirga kamogawensis]TRX69010.1 universal stress protein [Flammeovirga kamogawensis]
MSLFRRTLVALDGSEKDKKLLEHASTHIAMGKVEKLYFIHVQKSLNLPQELTDKYPDMLSPLDESIGKTMDTLIHKYIKNIDSYNYELMIEEGDPAETIIKMSKRKQVDIVIIGKNSSGERTGSVARKVASFAPCSVLFAPELLPEDRTTPNILLPLNFSDSSKEALEQTEELAKLVKDSKVIAINCFRVPQGYSSTGKSYDEVAKILSEISEKKLDNFVAQTGNSNHDITTEPILIGEDESKFDAIYKTAKKVSADLIVVGSKSRTFMASMVLSSTAEKLLSSDINLPILIYKSKGKALDIFNFFDRI